MKRTVITITWLLMLVAARGADIATTYHFSPGLSQEKNPIVSVLGGGWIALLVTNVLLTAAVGLATIAYYRSKPCTSLIPSSRSVWDFASLALYGKIMSKKQFITRRVFSFSLPPKGHRRILWQLTGFAMPPAILTGSLLAVFAWFATREWHLGWFIRMHASLGYALYLVPCLAVWIAAEGAYFSTEYRRAIDYAAAAPVPGK